MHKIEDVDFDYGHPGVLSDMESDVAVEVSSVVSYEICFF